MKVNFIQDEATPHNNLLLKSINDKYPELLNLWYATNDSDIYSWKTDLTNEIKISRIYGDKKINFKLIRKIFTDEKIFIVGWTNVTTKLLLILMCVLKRPYSMWFDLPNDNVERSWLRDKVRELFYFIIKISNNKIFCVGVETVKYFKKRGFKSERLINLPVFVPVNKSIIIKDRDISNIRDRLRIKEDDFLIVSGSRLVKEKGFDILINSIYKLKNKNKIKLIIIGQGIEKQNLQKLVVDKKLTEKVLFLDWMNIEEMKKIISSADLFVHPARWDAFGAGTLNAMALGVPVVASNQSGSGPDRIKNMENGFLYDANDTHELTRIIDFCFEHNDLMDKIAYAGFLTANEWPVERGRKILLENII